MIHRANVRRLRQTLDAGNFAITAEIVPPLSCDVADLLRKALPLRGIVDAVNVTDCASARAHIEAGVAASILVNNGIEPVLQLTCRDRNRIALQSEMVGAAAVGVKNLLIMKGDNPSAGDQPDAKAVFDLDTIQLVETAVAIRDRGELPYGRRVGGTAEFFIGVADMPIDPPLDWSPVGLLKKIAAGAQFAQTQFCMDLGIVRRYVERLRDLGVTEKLYLLIGIGPLSSAHSARWIRNHLYGAIIPDSLIARMEAADVPKAEGQRICVELLQQFAEIPGVAGAHIMAPLDEGVVPAIVSACGSIGGRRSAVQVGSI
jgi:methylenetetrahydrofolate reductase (NADPH)